MPGDNIYNGALDNATGCGILLEIARAYPRRKPPKRSGLFRCGHGGGTGTAAARSIWASIRRCRRDDISLALNYDNVPHSGVPEEVNVPEPSGRTSTRWSSARRRLPSDHRARPAAGRRTLLPLRPLQLRRAGSLRSRSMKATSIKATTGVGRAAGRGIRVQALPQPSDEYRPEMDFRGNAVIAASASRWDGKRRISRA